MQRLIAVLVVLGLLPGLASADVRNMGTGLTSLDTVPVGHPGNMGEPTGQGVGGLNLDRISGAVAYEYNIGKYEVTAAQYTVFLNAVAATDPYGLYNPSMWTATAGCKIQRSGASGGYAYSVAPDSANRPVNFVSWGDAARFANWLHNNQPTGEQTAATTEDGAYTLAGAVDDAALLAVVRNPGWKWAITSEDEWYKAAYHKNNGVTGDYWDYPTRTDLAPSNDLIDPDPGNNATFYANGYTIGSPYYRTEAGEFENSISPYGTYDQGGNVYEWTEEVLYSEARGLRGGHFGQSGGDLRASVRRHTSPSVEDSGLGFRMVHIPEPMTLAILAVGGTLIARRRRA